MVHLATNYAAVRCVMMRTLNRQRTNIVMSQFEETGQIMTPKQVSERERVLERNGVLRWRDGAVLGFGVVGVRFATVLTSLGAEWDDEADEKFRNDAGWRVGELAKVFRMQKYILWPTSAAANRIGHRIDICLKTSANAEDQVKAWSHALILAKSLSGSGLGGEQKGGRKMVPAIGFHGKMAVVNATMEQIDGSFPGVVASLRSKGWDLETPCIETTSGFRIAVDGDTAAEELVADDDGVVVLEGSTGTLSEPAYRKGEDKKVV